MDNDLITAVGKALELLRNPEGVVCVDPKTKEHLDLRTATSKRIPVLVLTNRDSAFDILKGVGIDLDNKKITSLFIELGEALGGKVKPRRINKTEAEKKAIVEESNHLKDETLKQFADRIGVGYQALIKWRGAK